MSIGFVHAAHLRLAPDGDERAPGGAITTALCGHWEHEGSCRWPHQTDVVGADGPDIDVRVVVGCSAEDRPAVQASIVDALDVATLDGPTGRTTWTVVTQGSADPTSQEQALLERWWDQRPAPPSDTSSD
jgi:hypothetical protein